MAVFIGRLENGNFDNFDAGPIACLADLLAAFRADGLVAVDILRNRRGDRRDERVVIGRRQALITAQRYVAIENATVRFIEETDE